MWFGPLISIEFLVLVVMLAMGMYRRRNNGRDIPGVRLRTPREILDERFAKGQIEREEYEARRKVLTES